MSHPNQALSLERLRALLDSYGANLAQFPAAERAPAETLLAQSVPAQKLWREAVDLDGLLAERPASLAPSVALMQRLHAIPLQSKRALGRASETETREVSNVVQLLPRRAGAWASLAAAAALLLGAVTGAQQDSDSADSSDDGIAQVEPSEDAAPLSDFAALALGGELVTDLGQFEGDAE